MNKVWKFLGVAGVVGIAVVAASVAFGKETTEEECNEMVKQVEETLGTEGNE